MGFKEFLLGFFPHRWLNINLPGNQRLFGGLGATLDQIEALVNQVRQEMRISTSVETIPIREIEYNLPVNPSLPLETRRANIIARKRDPGGPMTKEALINALHAYGVDVTIENDHANQLMRLKIEALYIEPEKMAEIQAFVEEFCRAHVGKEWEFASLTWDALDAKNWTWDQFDSLNLTWD